MYAKAGINMPMPTVSFDLRGKTAGMAYYDRQHVQLNAVLLTENGQAFIDSTVGHEVAHLASWRKYGPAGRGHGEHWKTCMRIIGQEPRRTHQYDVTNSRVGKVFPYKCACKTYQLSARRHRRAVLGGYTCLHCKTKLVPADQPTPARLPPTVPSTPQGSKSAATSSREVRKPTQAMATYAIGLARSLNRPLEPRILNDFKECARFIEQAREALIKPDPPTEKQRAYAQALSRKHSIPLPPETLMSKRAVSAWIDAALKAHPK